MNDPNTPRLSQIKLAEMDRQRSRLTSQYEAIEQNAAAADIPVERLRRLYEGLREVKFAQRLLHPDVNNLDLVFFKTDVYRSESPILQDMTRELETELRQGHLRAEYAYLFSLLLNEWNMASDNAAADLFPDRPDWSFLWNESPAPGDPGFIDAFYTRHNALFQKIREPLQKFLAEDALKAVTNEETKAVLDLIAGDIYRDSELRRLAFAIRNDIMQMTEYSSTLTILLNNLDSWDWPENGMDLRTLWVRHRWRPYLDEDLLTLLLLQVVGLRWGMFLKQAASNHILRLHAFNALNPARQEEEIDDEEEDEPDSYYTVKSARSELYSRLFLPNVPEDMYELESADGYSSFQEDSAQLDKTGPLEQLLAILNAEIRYHQTVSPTRSLTILQTDLREFFLRIPHSVLGNLLRNLGVPEFWLAFFRRFFRARVNVDGQPRVCRQGVPLDHLISVALADWLLLHLDLFVYEAANVRLLRVTDDIYFVADSAKSARLAWQKVQEFCGACGLEINPGKSGAICLGGRLARELPQGLVTWGLLRLTTDGTWEVDEEAFTQVENVVRRLADSSSSVLGMTGHINSYLPYIQRHLGLSINLGEAHFDRVGRRVGQFWSRLFGDGVGAQEEMFRRIAKRFPEARLSAGNLPEEILYWPVTAGGLGLMDPFVALMAFRKAHASLPVTQPPSIEKRAARSYDNSDYYYFMRISTTLAMAGPETTPVMEALINDFIARSNEVTGGDMKELSPYWRWIVTTYGKLLLEKYGTFRFLLTELVPLHLIVENRMDASSL